MCKLRETFRHNIMKNWIKIWWKFVDDYLNTQTGIFSFQIANTVNVASQTVVKILQFNLLCNATMARWTAYQNTPHTNIKNRIQEKKKTREEKKSRKEHASRNVNWTLIFGRLFFIKTFLNWIYCTYLNGLWARGFGVDVDFGTVGVCERPVCFVFVAIFKIQQFFDWMNKWKFQSQKFQRFNDWTHKNAQFFYCFTQLICRK